MLLLLRVHKLRPQQLRPQHQQVLQHMQELADLPKMEWHRRLLPLPSKRHQLLRRPVLNQLCALHGYQRLC